MYVKGTNAFFLQRATSSSIPFAIDDPPKTKTETMLDVNHFFVDIYTNSFKTANLHKGFCNISKDQRYDIKLMHHSFNCIHAQDDGGGIKSCLHYKQRRCDLPPKKSQVDVKQIYVCR